jgi:hypothetical protein
LLLDRHAGISKNLHHDLLQWQLFYAPALFVPDSALIASKRNQLKDKDIPCITNAESTTSPNH